MKAHDVATLAASGLLIWILGTGYYAFAGPGVLESTVVRYGISFALSPIVSAGACVAILRRRRIPHSEWALATLLLALPGMVGEAVLLTHLTTFMPRLHVESGGRYGALLFATYAVVLGIAVTVTLRAAPPTEPVASRA
jgi:hypothetical protein